MKRSITKLLGLAGIITILAMSVGCGDNPGGILPGGGNDNPDNPVVPVDNGKISGKVLFQEGITDHSDISVSLFKLEDRAVAGTELASVKTNAEGEYTFENLAAGSYTVLASYDDLAVFRSVEITANEIFTVENMNLVKKGSLKGVLELEGANVYQAEIYIPGTVYKATCDEEGNFEITGVPVGTYSLWIKVNNDIGTLGEEFEFTAEGNTLEDPVTMTYVFNYSDVDTDYNVTAEATDRGIKFTTRILRNTNTNATVTFRFRDNNAEVEMIRDWTKNSGWSTCETYYPFVEAGKTYNFTVTAVESDYTLYKKNIRIEATGGLGEYKIENAKDYTVEITDDHVMQLTAEPVFTENSNVNILDQGVFYQLYEDDTDNWSNWIYDQMSWLSNTNGKFSLKDDSDGLSKWRSFEEMDLCLSGHKYRAVARTRIKVAGYSDNGQTYFEMNDYKYDVLKPWGGEIQKVYVLFTADEDGKLDDNLKGLPGEKLTVVSGGTTFEYYGMVLEYNDRIYEPTSIPYYEGAAKSVLNGWKMYKYYGNCSFPFNISGSYLDDVGDEGITINGEAAKYITFLYPDITLKYNVTIKDGDNILETQIVTDGSLPESVSKTGYIFNGYYADKELTTSVSEITETTTVYVKWAEIIFEDVWTINEDYTFDVVEGQSYIIKWADSYQGSSSYESSNKVDVSVSCNTENETYFNRVDSGYTNPQKITASETGTCTLSFNAYGGNSDGEIYLIIAK